MTAITIQVAPRIGPDHPRGAQFMAWLFLAGSRLARALLSRAASAAERFRLQQDAGALRDLARHYRSIDPGFASDLMAAADRHERLHRPH